MSDIADTARQAAVNMEVKKHGLKQMQSGEWVLDLKVNAEDMPTALMAAGMGTRYIIALVEIGDDEEPVVRDEKKKQLRGGPLAQKAGRLCNDPRFSAYMEHCDVSYFRGLLSQGLTKPEAAAKMLRARGELSSRAELDHSASAAEYFNKVLGDFEYWKTA